MVAFSVLIGPLSGAASGDINPGATVIFFNPADKIDKFKHGDYLKQVGDEIGLTDEGWKIFTSMDTIKIVDRPCNKTNFGGCYIYSWTGDLERKLRIVSEDIHLRNYNHDFIKSTLIHELLHAIYLRISRERRVALTSHLLEVRNYDDTFRDGYINFLSSYPEESRLYELHSYIPLTQGIGVTQFLYDHYTTYFDSDALQIDSNNIIDAPSSSKEQQNSPINTPSTSEEQQNSPKERFKFKGWPIEELLDRDYLIASQEDLLNNYRCIYNVDTQIVPGGCGRNRSSDKSSHPGARDIDRNTLPDTVPQAEINVRDQLISDQENLLNVYRCRFNVDTQLVPNGCS